MDTPGLERDCGSAETPKAGSLAEKLGTENHYARLYVNFLLGGLVCCDSQEELETYPRSVTRDRLRHQSYRLQRMRRPTLYIGANARKARIKALEEELRAIQEQLTEAVKREKRVRQAYEACQRFAYERHPQRLIELSDAGEKVDRLDLELGKVRQKIRDFEENPLLRGLFDRVESCERDKAAAQRERDLLEHEKWKQNSIVEEAQREINRLLRESEAAETAYEQFCRTHPELTGEVEEHYDNAARTRTPEEIERNQRDYQSRCEKSLERYVTETLIPTQRTYNSRYADLPLGLEAVERYQDAYDTLVRIELERSKESLRKAQIRCKERFRKEVLFRMKDDIANAKAQFKSLERVMSQLTYGEEKYHFVLTDPKDRELRAFSQIIQDKNNLQITEEDSLFTREAMSQPAYEAQVDELMNRIMADINASAQDRSRGKKSVSEQPSKYVDYRTYLDYDILVENTVTGMKVPLSQVSGDNSGGENQAPYYVAICASLLQIYSQSDNCIRLVMLDEAFNNMTSDRIEPMMRMFRDLGMQLVLISTAEKCSAIYPYCDIVYSVVKYGTRATLTPFEKIEEDQDERGTA